MGIAWLLLRRTFASRPKRTILFLLGYALATAVMITLLAVGQAVLQQAQDKDLLGGGDLILVPQGMDIESMKVGGTSALYYSISQARFIVRQMLGSSRFENQITAISPYLFSKVVYLRAHQNIQTVFADGSIPAEEINVKGISLPWGNSTQDENWLNPPTRDFYHEIDHFHLPSVANADLNRWAEWHYFNFEGKDFYGYFTVMAIGNPNSANAHWSVTLQIVDGRDKSRPYSRYGATFPLNKMQLPLQKVDYSAGQSTIRFVNDHYEIALNFNDTAGVHGNLLFYPAPGLYFPPADLARSENFESGYVIPAIRGQYEGAIDIGKHHYDFSNIRGYHDHNWGIWQKTEWNWGHLFSNDYSIFFGEIFINKKSKGLFVAVFDRKGFLSVFRPPGIHFSDYRSGVPMKLEISDAKRFCAIHINGESQSYIPTKEESSYFIQYKMKYNVTLQIDGHTVSFPASGNAETYVPEIAGFSRH